MEGELEREIRREREKRLEVLRKELEAKEHERRSQAEEVRALALFKTLKLENPLKYHLIWPSWLSLLLDVAFYC
jgi:hypothetical protein